MSILIKSYTYILFYLYFICLLAAGTFAIVCLMTGKAVTAYSTIQHDDIPLNNITDNITLSPVYTPMQVATAVTLTVGIMQVYIY